jgi:CHAD domain-containing protein
MTTDAEPLKLWARDASALDALPGVLADLAGDVRRTARWSERVGFLDTADWWFHRGGACLRLTTGKGGATLALEPLRPDRAISPPSDQLQEALPAPPRELPGPLPGKELAAWLGPFVGEATVDRRLVLTCRPASYRLDGGEGRCLTVNVGRLAFARPRRAADPFAEVTLESPPGAAELLQEAARRLTNGLGFEAAEHATLARALELAGITPPELVEGDDLTLSKQDRFVDSAYRVMRRHFRRMLWNEPGTRLGLDPDYLHDMRVASRRMTAALRAFRKALPTRRVKSFRRDLKWVRSALGDVRDLDVYLMHLDEETRDLEPELQDSMELYRARLRTRRQRARRSMLRVLESKRYAQFVERLGAFLEAGPPEEADGAAGRLAVEQGARIIRRRFKRVLRDGRAIKPGSPDSDLHSLRIRCKRLRYACEFFTDLYGSPARKFAREVTKLQDVLGAHQDAVVARETLAEFARDVSGPPERLRGLYLALGRLMAMHAQQADATRTGFFAAWKRFDRKKVRKPLEARLGEYRA